MAKLSLVASPTFKAKVGIPVAGGDTVDVEFTFKHRTRKELGEFIQPGDERGDLDTVMACATGWELVEEFTRDNVETLIENYGGAALAIYLKYLDELSGQRTKN